jgi:hypothetical protein
MKLRRLWNLRGRPVNLIIQFIGFHPEEFLFRLIEQSSGIHTVYDA